MLAGPLTHIEHMELFLLYAIGLTIVAFLSIVMASPKVLPVAQQGSDNEPQSLEPGAAKEATHNKEPEEVLFSITTEASLSEPDNHVAPTKEEHT